MSDKKLAVLGMIAVIMTGWAVLQYRISQTTNTADFSSSPLIEGLDIEAVSSIQIASENGAKTVRLDRKNGRFMVADKDDYPADVGKINSLLNKCLDIRTTEKITSSPANHADLKVTEDTAHYVIRFLDKQGEPIVAWVLSETDSESGTAYARLLSSDDVYSIQSPPWINTADTDYMDTELVTVQRDKIESVAVKTSEGSYVLTSPADSDQITLEKMPEGKQYKGTTYKNVFGALSSLRFEDVMGPGSMPEGLVFDLSYTCRLNDLKVYKLLLAGRDDKTYARISMDYLDKTPVEKTVGQVESDEELKKKEAKLLAIDEVNTFNEKHKDWIYQIPSYKAGDLTKPLSDLIEDIPALETEEAKPEE